MEVGMLWRDDDQRRTLEEKVSRAVHYYREKYGRVPNICFVNKDAIAEAVEIEKVLVQPAKNVMPQHFWVGVRSTAPVQ